jgi:putative membrane protein
MWHDWDDMGLWSWAMMFAGGLLLLLLVLAIVVLILRSSLDKDGPDDVALSPSARELLDQRLARGEIDVDEYQERRDAMAAGPSPDLTDVLGGAPTCPAPR